MKKKSLSALMIVALIASLFASAGYADETAAPGMINLTEGSPWSGSVFGNVGGDPTVEHFEISEQSPGNVTIRADGGDKGKIDSSSEGIAYYFQQVPAEANYEVSATATVRHFGANNQVSFGIMLRSNVLDNVSDSSFSGNHVALGALDQAMKGFYREGYVDASNKGTRVKDGYEFGTTRPPAAGETYELKIRKFGNEYSLSIGGETKVIASAEALRYAGVYATRDAIVDFTDVTLNVFGSPAPGEWEFRTFGNSTNTTNNTLLDNGDGTVTMESTGGKIAGSGDGIAFYYKELPQNANYEIRATAVVESFNTAGNGQESFGLMARDEVGSHGSNEGHISRYVLVGGLAKVMKAASKNDTSNSGHATIHEYDGARDPAANESYDLSLRRTGDLFVLTVNGASTTVELDGLFADSHYVGLYVARNAKVTFSHFGIITDARVPNSLTADASRMKTDYIVGEELDTTGLQVTAHYDDGTEVLAANEYVVTGFDSSTAGTSSITVSLNGVSTTVPLNIVALEVTDMEILFYPAKTVYYPGDSFDPSGLEVVAEYNDGFLRETLRSDQYTFSFRTVTNDVYADPDPLFASYAGTVTVDVYSTVTPAMSASFDVFVKDADLLNISIGEPPAKTTYFIGDALDLGGMVVYANYSDASSVRLLRGEYAASGFDSSAPAADQLITISHKGATATFPITVKVKEAVGIEITEYPRTTYAIGEAFDSAGTVVSAVYDNGERFVLDPSMYVIDASAYDSNAAGVYPIAIDPIAPGLAAIELPVTVREPASREWNFIRFGQSIGIDRNKWEVIQDSDDLSERVIMLEATEGQNAGKITGDHDGITYYYTVIDAQEDNFELSADIQVAYYSKQPDHDGQESFGIMARDVIGQPDDSSVFSSNIAAVGGFAGRTTFTNGTKLFVRTGVESPDGAGSQGLTIHALKEEEPGPDNTELGEYRLTLSKTNSGFVGKLYDGEQVYEDIIYEPDILKTQDGEKMYVGFYAARYAKIEVRNIEFSVSAAATDAPKVMPPADPITPSLDVLSLDKTPLTEYELLLSPNVDGSISVSKEGNVLASNVPVTAGGVFKQPAAVTENDVTKFSITFIPDDTQNLSSFDKIIRNFAVTNRVFGGGTEDIIVSTDGTPNGIGTDESPVDIDTAIDFVKPGQTIVVQAGEYVRHTPLRIKKYNDGKPGAMKKLTAADGARPVFNFDKMSAGMLHEGNYWHVSGLDFTGAASNMKGYHLGGSHNLIEYSRFYGNGDSGFQISDLYERADARSEWPSYNTVQYSVAYDNADPSNNNADGFAIKLTVGDGNTLRGVIAHNNIDDGYDLYTKVGSGAIGAVVIEDSIAFNNGTLSDGKEGAGDKNGFKLGGEGVHVPHVIRDSLAFGNGKTGFTSNSNPGLIAENVIGFNNAEGNFDFSTYAHIAEDFSIDGVISHQRDYAARDRYPEDQAKPANYFFNGTVSANSEGEQLDVEQFYLAQPIVPINPHQIPDMVDQRDEDGNIVWGTFFKYFLPGNEIVIPGDGETTALLEDDFGLATTENLFTASYKSLPNDSTVPMYVKTGGTVTAADGKVTLAGGRMTIGALSSDATTADSTPGGIFDFSKPYRIIIDLAEASGTGKFQVYIDNNTTGSGNSIHGSASKYFEQVADELAEGELVIEPDIGTEASFIQLRTESAATVVIDSITVLIEGDAEQPAAPQTPEGLSATASSGQVALTWEESEGATSYKVLRSLEEDGEYEVIGETADTRYTDTGLANGRTYYYRVIAVNDAGESEASEAVSARPVSSGSSGGGNAPSNGSGDQLVVTDPQANNGKIAVEIAKDTKKVLLPAHAAAIGGNNRLSIEAEDVTLEIPAEVLAALQKIAADDADSQIAVTVERVDAEEAQTLMADAGAKHSANVTPAGDVFRFSLAVVNAAGEEQTVSEFEAPITITLLLSEDANADLVGVYYIGDDGELEYVGGTIADGRIVAEASHFSMYAALEYEKTFDDVSSGFWAADAITKLSAKHIIAGVTTTEFAPQRSVTRAEFAALLARALGLEAADEASFNDVVAGAWYAEAVAAAHEAGIIFGRSESSFDPNATITRQEMASMLVRAHAYRTGAEATVRAEAPFADRGEAAAWAREAIDAAYALGLVSGKGADRFDPLGVQTRAEAAQVIMNLLR